MAIHWRIALLYVLATLVVACGDETIGPGDDIQDVAPERLRVLVPDTILEDEAFPLAVEALDSAGAVDTGANTVVRLEASGGSLSPDSAVLSNGAATINLTLSDHWGPITITARSGTAEASATAISLSQDPVVRLEVMPAAILFTAPGQSRSLRVRAYDAEDHETVVDVTWSSSSDEVVTVSPAGIAESVGPIGSSTVVAQTTGAVSAPVLSVMARPVTDAVLVADSQVISAPSPVDSQAPFGLGWQYRVTLTAADTLGTDDLVLGTGEVPLGGRVVETTVVGDSQTIILGVVPPEELFAELSIDETIDLNPASAEIPASMRRSFDVQRLADGAVEFRGAPGADWAPRQLHGRTGPRAGIQADGLKFAMGPFECQTQAAVIPDIQIEGPTYTIRPALSLDIRYGLLGGVEKFTARGEIRTLSELKATVATDLQLETVCKAELMTLRVPFPGPLGLVLQSQVPVGVGLGLTGSTRAVGVGLRAEVETVSTAEIGLDCTADSCQMVSAVDATRNGRFEPSFDIHLADSLAVNLSGSVFGFATLKFGPPLSDYGIDAFEVQAGLKQGLSLASTAVQVGDPSQRSHFDLQLVMKAGAASSFERLKQLLKIEIAKAELETVVPLATSPFGSFSIDPPVVRPGDDLQIGDNATFTVTLDSVNYFLTYAVDAVEIYWKTVNEEGDTVLRLGRPSCWTIPASAGQTTFTCETDFLTEHTGEQVFYGFVRANLFGFPMPVPFEIADEAADTLNVRGSANFVSYIADGAVWVVPFDLSAPDLAPGEPVRQAELGPDLTTSTPRHTWSPDASRILFDDSGLLLTDADGANPIRISDYGSYPSWMPGSEGFVFRDYSTLQPDSLCADGWGAVRVAREGTWEPSALLEGWCNPGLPRWAPAGDAAIAVWQMVSEFDIDRQQWRGAGLAVHILDGVTGAPIAATDSAGYYTGFDWAPDGERVVIRWHYEHYDEESGDYTREERLLLMDRNGTVSRPFPHTETMQTPYWSPDGRWIAVGAHGDDNVRLIALFDADAGSVSYLPLDFADLANLFWVAGWTGDSEWIFVIMRTCSGDCSYIPYLVHRTGTPAFRMTPEDLLPPSEPTLVSTG